MVFVAQYSPKLQTLESRMLIVEYYGERGEFLTDR